MKHNLSPLWDSLKQEEVKDKGAKAAVSEVLDLLYDLFDH